MKLQEKLMYLFFFLFLLLQLAIFLWGRGQMPTIEIRYEAIPGCERRGAHLAPSGDSLLIYQCPVPRLDTVALAYGQTGA